MPRTFAALIWRARKAALEIPAGEEVRRERHLGAARRSRQKTGSGGAMACAFLGVVDLPIVIRWETEIVNYWKSFFYFFLKNKDRELLELL